MGQVDCNCHIVSKVSFNDVCHCLSQDATDRGHTLSNAVFLPLIPFCLLGFFNSLFILCGSQILKRTMNRASLVSFLGNTEEERTMGVDMTRVFCYSVLQLTFQV